LVVASDERERDRRRLENGDALVLEPDLHEDHSIDHAGPAELRDVLEVAALGRPDQQVVAELAGGVRGSDHVAQVCVGDPALAGGEQQCDDPAAPAREPSSHRVGGVTEFMHRGEDALARLVRDRAAAGERIGHRAGRDASEPRHIGPGRHFASSMSACEHGRVPLARMMAQHFGGGTSASSRGTSSMAESRVRDVTSS
jgi:hypothetical protein